MRGGYVWIRARMAALAGFLVAVSCVGQPAPLPAASSYGEKITVRSDLAYGDQSHQVFDLYRPAGVETAPLVVCWFGGAFWAGNKRDMGAVGAYFAAHGFAALAPGYFLGTKDGGRAAWPHAVYDAKAVVRHARANAAILGVDPNRIVGLGYSSGAYLAMMVGVTANQPQLEGAPVSLPEASRLSAIIAIAGVYDRRRTLGLPLGLLGKDYEAKHELRVVSSPVIYITPRTAPVFILHGSYDDVADVSSALQLAEVLRENRVAYELHIVDADHYPISIEQLACMVSWLRKIL